MKRLPNPCFWRLSRRNRATECGLARLLEFLQVVRTRPAGISLRVNIFDAGRFWASPRSRRISLAVWS
jgi:hypothetical protein